MRGPRLIFKDDRDSRIGRGAVIYAAHFRPEMAMVPYWAARTAPAGVLAVVISEGHRDIRDSRDLHEEMRAFDFSLNVIKGSFGERKAAGQLWARRLRAKLGPDYTVVVHGKGRNLHLHVELDP